MNKAKLYHCTLGFPAKLRFPSGKVDLRYSKHAIAASLDDRYGRFNLPHSLDLSQVEIIEAETVNGALNKVLVRMPLDEVRDLCVVIMPRDGLVKTVWINERSDKHSTLDESKYIKMK